jgi:hypothetical protein
MQSFPSKRCNTTGAGAPVELFAAKSLTFAVITLVLVLAGLVTASVVALAVVASHRRIGRA